MADMLTAKDIQDLLHVDRSTVYRMAEAGSIPAMRVGRQWRFPSDQVSQWLSDSATPATATPTVQSTTTTGNLPDAPLEKLLPLECVQLMQETFADLMDIMIVVTDMSGQPVTEVSHPCGPFKAISQLPNALEKCIADWAHFGEILELEPKLIRSHLGLLGTRGLIRVGRELKGMVIIGGIAPGEWPPAPEHLAEIAGEFGVTADAFNPYLDEVSFLSAEQTTAVLKMAQRFANILAHIITERRQMVGKLEAIAQIINQ